MIPDNHIFDQINIKNKEYYTSLTKNKFPSNSPSNSNLNQYFQNINSQHEKAITDRIYSRIQQEEKLQNKQIGRTIGQKSEQQRILHNNQIKRKLLQLEANQDTDIQNDQFELEYILTSNDQKTIKTIFQDKIQNNYMVKGRADHIWNDLSKIPQKNINSILTPQVIKRDEQGFLNTLRKIEIQQEEQKQLQEYKKFQHDLILCKFHNKQRINSSNLQKLKIEKKSEKPLSSQFFHNPESFNRITQHKKQLTNEDIITMCPDLQGMLIGDLDLIKISRNQIPFIQKCEKSKIIQKQTQIKTNFIKGKWKFFKIKRQIDFNRHLAPVATTSNTKDNKFIINKIRNNKWFTKNKSHLLTKWIRNLMQNSLNQNFIAEINEFENKFQTEQNNKKVKGYPAVQLQDQFLDYFKKK